MTSDMWSDVKKNLTGIILHTHNYSFCSKIPVQMY